MAQFKMVEKDNPLALHALFDTKERGEKHLAEMVPIYCKHGYYTDKTLTPESFEIVPA